MGVKFSVGIIVRMTRPTPQQFAMNIGNHGVGVHSDGMYLRDAITNVGNTYTDV